MSEILSWASKFESLPVIGRALTPKPSVDEMADAEKYSKLQHLSMQCAHEISLLIQPGWTEAKAAALMDTWLRDHGVKAFFHKPFVWWGNRTRFDGVKNYWHYLPTNRSLREGEVFILDVAPIMNGYVSDIGFCGRIGQNNEYDRALADLIEIRSKIPNMIVKAENGRSFWNDIDLLIKQLGYENIHAKYPFGVLGHRLRRINVGIEASFIHFGWQSYWDYLSRGLFGQILNHDFAGSIEGLWAIEPHIGTKDFGIKFEEILCVRDGKAWWLNEKPEFHNERNI